MQQVSEESRFTFYRLHALIGCLLLVLTLGRLVWKWVDNAPSPPAELGKLHLKGMKIIHGLLYLVILILTVNGIILMVQSGLISVLRGTTHDFPNFAGNNARQAHGTLARVYIGLLIAHIGGVILHQIKHGDLFPRMGIGKPSPPKV